MYFYTHYTNDFPKIPNIFKSCIICVAISIHTHRFIEGSMWLWKESNMRKYFLWVHDNDKMQRVWRDADKSVDRGKECLRGTNRRL